MGKTIKYLFKIVIFPVTIIFYFLRLIYRFIDKKITYNYIRNIDIHSLDSLTGVEFEKFLYYSFRSLGLKVIKTQDSRDYGADLVLHMRDQTIVIQSKLYFNHNVGNSAIQEIVSARTYYSADGGVVITNSFFTKSAHTLADSTQIKLIDRSALTNFLSLDRSDKIDLIHSWIN